MASVTFMYCNFLSLSMPFLIPLIQHLQIPGKAHLDFSFARPSLLTYRLPSITTFFTQTHQILALILSSLSSSLKLPPNASLTDLHRIDASSPDILRLLHYIAQPVSNTGVPQTPHTDLGSLTLLFTKTPGLQVLHPHSTEWAFVVPKRGCTVVNIGDGMSLQRPAFLTIPLPVLRLSYRTLNCYGSQSKNADTGDLRAQVSRCLQEDYCIPASTASVHVPAGRWRSGTVLRICNARKMMSGWKLCPGFVMRWWERRRSIPVENGWRRNSAC